MFRPFLTTAFLTSALLSAAPEGIVYFNDFTSEGLPYVNHGNYHLDTDGGVLNYTQPTGGGTVSATSGVSISGAAGADFVLSSRFTVNAVQGSGNTITMGFSAFAGEGTFVSGLAPFYLADWGIGGGGAGNLRILYAPGGSTPGSFSSSGASGANAPGAGVAGNTYELKLTGTYTGGTLDMTLALFDESGDQLGGVATARDTNPLPGEFFGLRHRTAGSTHGLNIDHDDFSYSGAISDPGPALPATFEDWRAAHFSEDDLEDPLVSGPFAEAIGDGISNLVKYALGLGPHDTDRGGLPVAAVQPVTVDGIEEHYLTFTYTRLLAALDIEYLMEVSSSLVAWEEGQAVLVDETNNGDGTKTVTFRLGEPIHDGERQFVRLRVRMGSLSVSSDFPGGSAEVQSIDQGARIVRINPAPGPGWDSWWHARIDGIRPGEEIALNVGGGPEGGIWSTPDRAFFRIGDGEWQRTKPGERLAGRVTYRETIDAESAWFAWGEPFLLEDSVALVEAAAGASPYATSFFLTESLEGRPVPALRVSEPGVPDEDRFKIWIQARQHAWESGSSWVCRGFVEWLMSDDPKAEDLRQKAEINIVPIMDVDNVERGAGGKSQEPQDHNRDWTADPHWPEVRAAQERISEMVDAGRFDVFIDLHNPHPRERDTYFFIAPSSWMTPAQQANQAAFVAVAEAEMNGPLPFRGNTRVSSEVTTGRSWVILNTTNDVLAITIESPWNSVDSTAENYQNLGRQIGFAIERFLRERPSDQE